MSSYEDLLDSMEENTPDNSIRFCGKLFLNHEDTRASLQGHKIYVAAAIVIIPDKFEVEVGELIQAEFKSSQNGYFSRKKSERNIFYGKDVSGSIVEGCFNNSNYTLERKDGKWIDYSAS